MGEGLPLEPEQVQQPEGQDQTGHIDVVDQNATDPSILQQEEQESPYRVVNEEKAQMMAEHMDRTHGRGFTEIDAIADFMADQYEVGKIAKRDVKDKDPSAIFRLMRSNTSAMLRYGNELANNQQEYGENLHPGLKVFQTVHKLAERYPKLLESGFLSNEDMTITLESPTEFGFMNVSINSYGSSTDAPKLERWQASPFSNPNFGNHYTVETEPQSDEPSEGGFDEVTLVKSRRMQIEDAQHLEDLLKDVNFDPETD